MKDIKKVIEKKWGKEPEKFWDKAFKVKGKETAVTMFLNKTSMGHHCGYAIFEKPQLLNGKDMHYKIVAEIPVHGGLNFVQKYGNLTIYGFDCGHCDDDAKPFTKDMKWLTEETERMTTGILLIKESEHDFINASNKEKVVLRKKYYEELEKAYKENGLEADEHEDMKCDIIYAFAMALQDDTEEE
jgi:hypothetical protein